VKSTTCESLCRRGDRLLTRVRLRLGERGRTRAWGRLLESSHRLSRVSMVFARACLRYASEIGRGRIRDAGANEMGVFAESAPCPESSLT
jgi:hypothetical protein